MDQVPTEEANWPRLQRRMAQALLDAKNRNLNWADTLLPDVDAAEENANTLFRWLTAQSDEKQADLVEALFARLLARSAKSRAASVNACTKLCGFVQHCAQADAERHAALVEWAFGASVALRLFDFYLEWNETDQHRSMKLVLDLLALLLTAAKTAQIAEQQAAVRAYVLRTVVGIVSGEIARPLAKSAIGSLHNLLGKHVFGMDAVGRAYQQSLAAASDGEPESQSEKAFVPLTVYARLVSDVLQAMALPSAASVAGKLLLVVFFYLRTTAAAATTTGSTSQESRTLSRFTTAQWLTWLMDNLKGQFALAEDIKTFFFLPLFKADRASALELLLLLNKTQRNVHSALDARAMLRLAALEAGKRRGLVTDAGLILEPRNDLSIPLDEYSLEDVLAHGSASMRSLTVSLLVVSPSAQRPLSAATLALLRRFLLAFHAEADAKFRLELLSHERHLCARLLGARRALDAHTKVAPWYTQEVKAQHDAFLEWFLLFLCEELGPTASYQRHFTALKAMQTLVPGAEYYDEAWVQPLLELLLDPFDDVRASAMDLLARVPPALLDQRAGNKDKPSLRQQLVTCSERADVLASRTARADHADGAARCQALLCRWTEGLEPRLARLRGLLDRLEANIAEAQHDLGAAVSRHPVHGDFAAVRYVWTVLAGVSSPYAAAVLRDELAPVQARIVRCAEVIWQVTRPVLCDDAPEGHMPAGLGDGGDDVSALDSKNVLSYSFRAVSEASSLLGTLVGGLHAVRSCDNSEGRLIPTREVFETVGNLAFAQLAALRHRGALTAVAHTFLLCCQLADHPLVARPKTEDPIVAAWYQDTLGCIRDQRSTTRRSAGIPSLFAGILASPVARPPFSEAMQAVCAIAAAPAHVEADRDDAQRPQVHALNCLREVFRSGLLSRRAETLLPACLALAAACLRSPVWAIRNGGLLLLRSLIDCLFGTGESKAALASGWDGRTLRVSYKNHPTLPGVLLELLVADGSSEEAVEVEMEPAVGDAIQRQQAAAESVFPALDILRRAGPPETHRAELYSAVVAHLGSHLWHVREMAARTVCSFFVLPAWPGRVEELLVPPAGTSGWVQANRLHGRLLAVRFVLDKLDETESNAFSEILPALLYRLDDTASHSSVVAAAPAVAAAYLETRNTVCGLALQHGIALDLASAPPVCPPAAFDAALWRVQYALAQNYTARSSGERAALAVLVQATIADPDTAVRLLDAIPKTWFVGEKRRTADAAAWLSALYLDVCAQPSAAPDVRATALQHLADDFLNVLLVGAAADDTKKAVLHPLVPALDRAWAALAADNSIINPPLACAIVRASGSFVAAVAVSVAGDVPRPKKTGVPSLAAWTPLVEDAGRDVQTVDMRLAAAMALRSYVLAVGQQVCSQTADNVAFAFCVYDALIDDDDTIRAVAAMAAGVLLGDRGVPVPGVAAARLPTRMADMFVARDASMQTGVARASASAFLLQAVGRLIGQTPRCHTANVPFPQPWAETAGATLRAAHQADDALFAIEEKNLFLDEAREARRWAAALRRMSTWAWRTEQATGEALIAWADAGLEEWSSTYPAFGDEIDGPLGWTGKPAVFAVYVRLLECAKLLLAMDNNDDGGIVVKYVADSFRRRVVSIGERGTKVDMHRMLVRLATGNIDYSEEA